MKVAMAEYTALHENEESIILNLAAIKGHRWAKSVVSLANLVSCYRNIFSLMSPTVPEPVRDLLASHMAVGMTDMADSLLMPSNYDPTIGFPAEHKRMADNLRTDVEMLLSRREATEEAVNQAAKGGEI